MGGGLYGSQRWGSIIGRLSVNAARKQQRRGGVLSYRMKMAYPGVGITLKVGLLIYNAKMGAMNPSW